jgi:hypothetical protein
MFRIKHVSCYYFGTYNFEVAPTFFGKFLQACLICFHEQITIFTIVYFLGKGNVKNCVDAFIAKLEYCRGKETAL